MAEISVDVSELEAPMPLVEALKAARELREGDYIRMVHRMEPCFLYEKLRSNNLFYKTVYKDEGVEVFICHEGDRENRALIEELADV